MKKFVSWNVNGLRAIVGKNFCEVFHSLDADIFCLQETKLQKGQIDISFDGYYQYWNYAEKKGYSGTAVFTKEEPIDVSYGIGIEEHDKEGRVITLEYDNFYFVCVKTPKQTDTMQALLMRRETNSAFLKLRDLQIHSGSFIPI